MARFLVAYSNRDSVFSGLLYLISIESWLMLECGRLDGAISTSITLPNINQYDFLYQSSVISQQLLSIKISRCMKKEQCMLGASLFYLCIVPRV